MNKYTGNYMMVMFWKYFIISPWSKSFFRFCINCIYWSKKNKDINK